MKRVLFVASLCILAVPVLAQELPPAPPTCTQAVDQSNLLAYNGNAKNTADYWCPMYDADRTYFWKRMLGWQAEGGPDQALSGFYAVPPSAWHGEPSPPDPGHHDDDDARFEEMLVKLGELERGQVQLRQLVENVAAAQATDTEAIRDDIRTFREQANSVLKEALKYLPALAALLGAKAF